ncbi:MAG: Tet(A)/Tet(B)/Tet(C) family tetracycline efflux MFS transporter [Bauldia sp.]
MNKPLAVILAAVTIDSIGIGLIFPILPGLLREVTHSPDVALLYGVILALYALMQFIFSPVLGALSDRYGRRPLLLLSLGGTAIDYLIMAFAPVFAVLLVGRIVSGITSASMSIATAYIADITPENERARRFGYVSACFGLGFIIGPIAGGLLGEYWIRAPFLLAAALNAANFALALFVLPESRTGEAKPLSLASLSPLGPMKWALGLTALLPLLAIFVIFALVGNIPGTIWVLYGQDKFGWDMLTVGASLAVFGLCHAGSQAFLTGPLVARIGEWPTMILGMVFDGLAFVLVGLATQGWMPFALAPLFAAGGVGLPALQALLSNQVSGERQGELQGVLASLQSLTAIVGPLVGTAVYAATIDVWIGAVWFLGAALYALTLPLLFAGRRRAAQPA